MKIRSLIGVCFFIFCLTHKLSGYTLEPTELELKKWCKSIVKITSKTPNSKSSRISTGFVWKRPDWIVCCLHAVNRASTIICYSQNDRREYSADIIQIVAGSDLALLKLKEPSNMPVLNEINPKPLVGDECTALGHEGNSDAILNRSLKIRFSSEATLSATLPSEKWIRAIERTRCLGLDEHVIWLGGERLIPGYSGGPIFDNKGRLIAIGDGGIETGPDNQSWGIPSTKLLELENSLEPLFSLCKNLDGLYSADVILPDSLKKTITWNGFVFNKTRTRDFKTMSQNADDRLGAKRLRDLFINVLDVDTLYFDIYEETGHSGATIVIPQGFEIISTKECIVVRSPSKRAQINFQLSLNPSISPDAMLGSQYTFQQLVMNKENDLYVRDPLFPDIYTYARFDDVLYSHEFIQKKDFSQYIYETFASKDKYQLAAAAISFSRNNNTNGLESESLIGDLETIKSDMYAWPNFIIAVHLSSFSI